MMMPLLFVNSEINKDSARAKWVLRVDALVSSSHIGDMRGRVRAHHENKKKGFLAILVPMPWKITSYQASKC